MKPKRKQDASVLGMNSCFNCIHSNGYRNEGCFQTFWDPGESPSVEECDAPFKDGEWESLYARIDDDIAEICPHYKSEMVKCVHCGKEHPANESQWACGHYSDAPVCSDECNKAVEAEMRKEMEEEMKAAYEDKEMLMEIEAEKFEKDFEEYVNSGRADEDYERYKDYNRNVLRRNNL